MLGVERRQHSFGCKWEGRHDLVSHLSLFSLCLVQSHNPQPSTLSHHHHTSIDQAQIIYEAPNCSLLQAINHCHFVLQTSDFLLGFKASQPLTNHPFLRSISSHSRSIDLFPRSQKIRNPIESLFLFTLFLQVRKARNSLQRSAISKDVATSNKSQQRAHLNLALFP